MRDNLQEGVIKLDYTFEMMEKIISKINNTKIDFKKVTRIIKIKREIMSMENEIEKLNKIEKSRAVYNKKTVEKNSQEISLQQNDTINHSNTKEDAIFINQSNNEFEISITGAKKIVEYEHTNSFYSAA